MPLTASEHVNVTVTGPLFQPVELAAGVTAALIAGAVLSMFNVMVAVALLPAPSCAVPEICWLAPSVDTRMGAGQTAIPPVPPRQVKLTTTLLLFQPAAFGCG